MFHWYWMPATDTGVVIYGMPSNSSEAEAENCPCLGMHQYYNLLLAHIKNASWFEKFGEYCSPGTATADLLWTSQFLIRWDSCVDTAFKAMGHASVQPARFWDVEYAFEEHKGEQFLNQVLGLWRSQHSVWQGHADYSNLDLHGRYGAKEEAFLSMCEGYACAYFELSLQANVPPELLAVIPAHDFPTPTVDEFNIWAKPFVGLAHGLQGRPHWGKMHDQFEAVGYIRSVYPHVDDFLSACRVLDPRGLQRNEFYEAHLQEHTHANLEEPAVWKPQVVIGETIRRVYL